MCALWIRMLNREMLIWPSTAAGSSSTSACMCVYVCGVCVCVCVVRRVSCEKADAVFWGEDVG
jgi:hypothetical protein